MILLQRGVNADMSMLLKQVNFPKDIKNMTEKELKQLTKEIRYFLIKSVIL